MDKLLLRIKACTICEKKLPLGPRPIVEAHPLSKVVIIGQAPGSVVHKTGVPWDDKSGENLRRWMGIDPGDFYDSAKVALIPMGFCYPGRGKSGDNPPTKECAPAWHSELLSKIEKPDLILLIGKYAQDYYLGKTAKRTLTETVKSYQEYFPKFFVLPHPSPRNNIWQARNSWFAGEVLPDLARKVEEILARI